MPPTKTTTASKALATPNDSRLSPLNPITGIIQVTGEPDTGKTDFWLQSGYKPQEMFIVDDDIKTYAALERIALALNATVNELFPMYHNFAVETEGMRELQIHAHGLDLMEKAITQQPKMLVWDTWARMAKTCHPYVVSHPDMFRQFWAVNGQIKGAEQWQVAQQYEVMLYTKMLRAAPTVFLVTHLKDDRINGIKTGKQIPESGKSLLQKATLRLYLRHNPKSPAPIGLVLKRIEKWTQTAEGLEAIAVLPRRLEPCTWKKIREYWNNPIGDRTPTKEETPTDFEMSILEGTLTKDQMQVFRAGMLNLEEQEPALEISKPNEQKELAQELKAEGKSTLQISKALSDKFGKRVMPADVIRLLNGE